MRLEIWTETDQAAIFYYVALSVALGVRSGGARCAVRSVLFGLAWRVRRRVTGPVEHSGSKMSYAATASFPASSFVLEAR